MSDIHEDMRKSGRRERSRRVYDMLEGILTEEERQQFDKMQMRLLHYANRRTLNRRSGKDRRAGGGMPLRQP